MEVNLAAITEAQSRLPARTQALAVLLRWLLIALAASLPFELNGGLALAGLTFTNVELVALVSLGVWGLLITSERRAPCVPRWLVVGGVALLTTFVLSALLADTWRGEALKFTARQAQGLLLGFCLADQLSVYGWAFARRLTLALLGGATISATLGLLEVAEIPLVLDLLRIFKDQPTLAGGLLRLSATFTYANIAAMYFEALLPLALLALGLASGRRAWLFAGAALLLFAATLLTYSRAALLTAMSIVVLVALGSVASGRRDRSGARFGVARVVGVCTGLLVFAAALLLFSPSFQTRMTEPDVDRWYRAEYLAPAMPRLTPNSITRVPVNVTNQGLVTWYSNRLRPVALSYHWLDAQTRLVVRYNGLRTPLPGPVAPGTTVRLDAAIQAPDRPGTYLLVWDMVVEQGGWFSERGNQLAETPVTVAGAPVVSQPAPVAEPAGLPRTIAPRPPPPERRVLWGAAYQLWRDRPLLGIGPDVFRHVYGPVIGLRVWDDRIHTNNLYLEILVGAGVPGVLAFLALLIAAGGAGVRALARNSGRARLAVFGCLVGLGGYLMHGTLDMFLEYSATYMLAWALLGALGALSTPQMME